MFSRLQSKLKISCLILFSLVSSSNDALAKKATDNNADNTSVSPLVLQIVNKQMAWEFFPQKIDVPDFPQSSSYSHKQSQNLFISLVLMYGKIFLRLKEIHIKLPTKNQSLPYEQGAQIIKTIINSDISRLFFSDKTQNNAMITDCDKTNYMIIDEACQKLESFDDDKLKSYAEYLAYNILDIFEETFVLIYDFQPHEQNKIKKCTELLLFYYFHYCSLHPHISSAESSLRDFFEVTDGEKATAEFVASVIAHNELLAKIASLSTSSHQNSGNFFHFYQRLELLDKHLCDYDMIRSDLQQSMKNIGFKNFYKSCKNRVLKLLLYGRFRNNLECYSEFYELQIDFLTSSLDLDIFNLRYKKWINDAAKDVMSSFSAYQQFADDETSQETLEDLSSNSIMENNDE